MRLAAARGVRVLALTDHDTTDGVTEAQAEAALLGVRLIPGIEVSVSWSSEVIHVVGLGVDPGAPALRAGIEEIGLARIARAEEMARKLELVGIGGALEGAMRHSGGGQIGRTHFARFLAGGGYASDVRTVFKHYLTPGKPGYVKGRWADLDRAVEWIRSAGGQAVIAHPARYSFTRTRLRKLLAQFCEFGGVGLEVVSGSHSRDECLTMARHARDFGLMGSVGSDYHGPEVMWRDLGAIPPLPEGLTPIWSEWESLPILESAAPQVTESL